MIFFQLLMLSFLAAVYILPGLLVIWIAYMAYKRITRPKAEAPQKPFWWFFSLLTFIGVFLVVSLLMANLRYLHPISEYLASSSMNGPLTLMIAVFSGLVTGLIAWLNS